MQMAHVYRQKRITTPRHCQNITPVKMAQRGPRDVKLGSHRQNTMRNLQILSIQVWEAPASQCIGFYSDTGNVCAFSWIIKIELISGHQVAIDLLQVSQYEQEHWFWLNLNEPRLSNFRIHSVLHSTALAAPHSLDKLNKAESAHPGEADAGRSNWHGLYSL